MNASNNQPCNSADLSGISERLKSLYRIWDTEIEKRTENERKEIWTIRRFVLRRETIQAGEKTGRQ